MKYKIKSIHENKNGEKIDINDKLFEEYLKNITYNTIKENIIN